MLWEHRTVVAVIVLAFTIVGVGAGIRLAQIEEQVKWKMIEKNQIVGTELPAPIKTDETFFVEKPAEKAIPQDRAELKPKTTPTPTPTPKAIVYADGVMSESYIVGDLKTGRILLSRNPDKILPFASMSKLVTAIVATGVYASSTKITVPAMAMQVPQDASAVVAGEIFTVRELLYPLLMNSSNVAGETLASPDRDGFLAKMSEYCWEIGMPESKLADPTGLSASNSGTSRGFFGLAQYLYKERPDILAYTRLPSLYIGTTSDHGGHTFTNIHPFVNDSRFLGGKTGYTPAALDTMLTILNMDGRPTAFIVLRSNNRAKDTTKLIEEYSRTASLYQF